MHLFESDEDSTEYNHISNFVECIMFSAIFATVSILLWAGSKLVGGSEL